MNTCRHPWLSLLTTGAAARFAVSFVTKGKQLARAGVDLVYPPCCAWCAGELGSTPKIPFCPDCREQLVPAIVARCRRCAAVVNPLEQDAADCSRCRAERFQFSRVFALARYEGPLRKAVLRMKRASEEPLMMAMGRLLVERFAEDMQQHTPDVVVPIPMHWTRRLVRGTNSPELMGAMLAHHLRLPFAPRLLRRNRRTKKLADLTRQERKRTLRDAFRVAKRCDFSGAHVLLVDDVLTTGTTCDVAARALKTAGAAEVSVIVAARAYPGE